LTDKYAEERDGDSFPQEAMSRLPQHPQVEGVDGCQGDNWPACVPHRKADGILRALGAHLHRDAPGPPVR
jgi:hypothetical protein